MISVVDLAYPNKTVRAVSFVSGTCEVSSQRRAIRAELGFGLDCRNPFNTWTKTARLLPATPSRASCLTRLTNLISRTISSDRFLSARTRPTLPTGSARPRAHQRSTTTTLIRKRLRSLSLRSRAKWTTLLKPCSAPNPMPLTFGESVSLYDLRRFAHILIFRYRPVVVRERSHDLVARLLVDS